MFRSKSGKHDTTIHETVAPAVQNETITRREHEQSTTAVDREVHQDHYHTSEQPVNHSEILPEQHHHKAAAVETRSFEHDSPDQVKRGLEDERARYQDTQTRAEGEKTFSENQGVQGEHMHHHVHETIQPVVNKQTIEPHVVHTTVPIHEVHHNAAHHHSASALPPVSMDDFKQQGGSLGGREERSDFFKGEPRSFGGHTVDEDRSPGAGTTNHAGTDPRTMNATTDRIGSDNRTLPSGTGQHSTPIADQHMGNRDGYQPGATGQHYGTDGQIGSRNQTQGNFGTTAPNTSSDSTSQSKPSLMDKLNPKVDASGDGKAGFMK